MLAGLGLGAGVAVGTVGAAIGLASARQEVKTTFWCCNLGWHNFLCFVVIWDGIILSTFMLFQVGLLFRLFNQGAAGGLTLADAIVGDDVLKNI